MLTACLAIDHRIGLRSRLDEKGCEYVTCIGLLSWENCKELCNSERMMRTRDYMVYLNNFRRTRQDTLRHWDNMEYRVVGKHSQKYDQVVFC